MGKPILVFREGAQGELGHGDGSSALFGFGFDKTEAGRHTFFRGHIFSDALKRVSYAMRARLEIKVAPTQP